MYVAIQPLAGAGTFNLTFQALDNGVPPKSGTATITINVIAVGAPKLQVFDGATNVTLGSGTVNLGSIYTGGAVATKTFTIKNTGTTAITVQPATVTVGAGFTILSNLGVNQTIFAGNSATIVVQLDSAVAGSKTGTLSFTSNDASSSPTSFNLTGTVATLGTTIDNGPPLPHSLFPPA